MDKLFSNKVYDVLKWIAIVLLPALTTLVGVVLVQIGYAHTETVVIIMTALGTFLGTILGVSNAQYKANKLN